MTSTPTIETAHDTYVAAVQLHADKLQTVATTTDAKELLQAEAEAQIIERQLPALREAHAAAQEAESRVANNWWAEQSLISWKASETALRAAVAALGDVVHDIADAALSHLALSQSIQLEASSRSHERIHATRFGTAIDGVSIRSESEAVGGSVAKILSQLYSALGQGVIAQDLLNLHRSSPHLTTESI